MKLKARGGWWRLRRAWSCSVLRLRVGVAARKGGWVWSGFGGGAPVAARCSRCKAELEPLELTRVLFTRWKREEDDDGRWALEGGDLNGEVRLRAAAVRVESAAGHTLDGDGSRRVKV
eukprot:6163632-Prymnesium_polylepis.1